MGQQAAPRWSGAAVAAGIVPVASANDGGGSTRIPASYCGLVALIPPAVASPEGRTGQDPGHGISRRLVVCRTVRDLAAALDVCSREAIPATRSLSPDRNALR
ncbi:hypothetical protein EOC93_08045 [Mesorhizobium sp. M6A.T.Ce.TU.002.03.1.1]|nr:hypothetical protein EOC93_08045 [Mesorhizobium sp. M6A.T.Ce.TU.002.03.1.1]